MIVLTARAGFCVLSAASGTSVTAQLCKRLGGYRLPPQAFRSTAKARGSVGNGGVRGAATPCFEGSRRPNSPLLAWGGCAKRSYHRRLLYRGLCLATRDGGVAPEGLGENENIGHGLMIARLLRKKRRRLVLHFDLNKTLMMVDPAGNKTQTQVLNSILAETCWGRVHEVEGESAWTWDGCPPSPEHSPDSEKQSSFTYSDFLHEEFADVEGGENKDMKHARDQRKGAFTEEGQPGFKLRKVFQDLERALSMPVDVADSLLANDAGLAGRESYYIIPSFYECLIALKTAGADFAVVFRTFGSDIPTFAREYNAFCEGRHPLHPGWRMDGSSDGEGDYRIHLEGDQSGLANVGAFYRDEGGSALIMGTLDNARSREDIRYAEEQGSAILFSIPDINRAICDAVNSPLAPKHTTADASEGNEASIPRRCLALRDYYPYWRSQLEDADAAKLLPVDSSEQAEAWAIFFDDNIGRLGGRVGAHIVDIRDAKTGERVLFETARKRHAVRAEPYLALTRGSANYFLDEIWKKLSQRGLQTSSSVPVP